MLRVVSVMAFASSCQTLCDGWFRVRGHPSFDLEEAHDNKRAGVDSCMAPTGWAVCLLLPSYCFLTDSSIIRPQERGVLTVERFTPCRAGVVDQDVQATLALSLGQLRDEVLARVERLQVCRECDCASA